MLLIQERKHYPFPESAGHVLDPQIRVGTTVSGELSLVVSWELAYSKFH